MMLKHSRNLSLERRLVIYISLLSHKRTASPYKLSFRNRHISEIEMWSCPLKGKVKL